MGCQDNFGCNMRPTGGLLGGMAAFGGGTEFQGHGTPHFHAQGHIVCTYQYATLADIAAKLERGLIETRHMKSFQDWFHVERPLDPQAHAAYEDRAGTEFFDRLQKPEHAPLCQTPAFLHEDANDRSTPTLASAYQSAHEMQTIEEEGRRFSKHYLLDAQFVFSRVQHHVHRQTKDGEFMPLNACAKKADGLTVASRNVSPIRMQKEIIKMYLKTNQK